MKEVLFDADRRDRLRNRYEVALQKNEEQFIFESMPLYTPYAKYLLEYLDSSL